MNVDTQQRIAMAVSRNSITLTEVDMVTMHLMGCKKCIYCKRDFHVGDYVIGIGRSHVRCMYLGLTLQPYGYGDMLDVDTSL